MTKVGFIGFGEAASQISAGLVDENNIEIRAFDVNCNHPELGLRIKERARQARVVMVDSVEELVLSSTMVISTTSAKYAEAVAQDAKPFLSDQHLFVDMNAASPKVKEQISKMLDCRFADVAIMESVPNYKHRVPMLVSGSGAEGFKAFADAHHMDATLAGELAGEASAIKMVRSVFIKGFTMLLIETLSASERYGVTEQIMKSLDQTLRKVPLDERVDGLITRTVEHAERRVAEMGEVNNTLEQLSVDSSMSKATKEKLEKLVGMNLKSQFKKGSPENFREVIHKINEYRPEKQHTTV